MKTSPIPAQENMTHTKGSVQDSQLQGQLYSWALVSGVLSVVFYVLHDVIGAAYYPGYVWMSQAVSDLTAIDAPSFVVASGYSSVYGILSCMCCAFLCVIVRNARRDLRIGIYLYAAMQGISAVGYSLFPLTGSGYDNSPQSFVHVYVVTVLVVVLSIASLVLIARGSIKSDRRTLGVSALLALLCMFVGAVGSANVPHQVFGVVERLSTYSAVLFTAVLGFHGPSLGRELSL